MARFNKIFAGPVTEVTPQVTEAIAAATLLPGIIAILNSSGLFAVAGAATNEKVYIVQDNYLTMKTVADAWASGDRAIGMEPLDEQFFNVVVPTGVSCIKGVTKLTTNASGKLIIATTGQRIIATADETYNNNTGSDQLVRVRAAKAHLAAV